MTRSHFFGRSRAAGSMGVLATLALASVAGAQSLVVGPNINISKKSGYQGEEAIAINPTNPQNLFVLSNDQGAGAGNSMFGAVSTNGGLTWTGRQVATGTDSIAAACCDPTVAFDNFGNLFMSYIDSATSNIIVARSINGGTSFSQVAAFNGSIDQPTINTGPGSVWVTYNSNNNAVARGASVSGLGNTGAFTSELALPGGSGGSFGDVGVGSNGRVAVTYQDNTGGNTGSANIFVNVSTAASTVTAPAFGARILATTTNVSGFDFIPPQPKRSVDAEAGVAWDRSGGAHNNRLYLVYTDEVPDESNNMRISLRYSDDNGATWSSGTQVASLTTKARFFSKLAVDPVTGHVGVVWYDARNDAANTKVEVWGAVSLDGGQTFLPDVKISAGQSDGTQANIGNGNEFGDYMGLAFYNDVLRPIWADSSNSTGDNPDGTKNLDLYTAAVTVTPEPSAVALLAGPLAMLLAGRRRPRG